MNICIAFDNHYVEQAKVLIESIIQSNSADIGSIHFWLLAHDISAQNMELLQTYLSHSVHFDLITEIPVDTSLAGLASNGLHSYTAASLARLYLDALLPKGIDRILYLDSDILCLGSLRSLFTTDLSLSAAAAVRDVFTRRIVDGRLPGLDRYLNIDHQRPYFNSGVLLINRPLWRHYSIELAALEYVRNNKGVTRFPVQDALNVALHGLWKPIGKEWNYMRPYRLEPQFNGFLRHAALVHFITAHKVWEAGYIDGELKRLYMRLHKRVRLIGSRGDQEECASEVAV